MALMQDVVAAAYGSGIQPALAEVLGEIAAVVVCLEQLSERIQMGVVLGERDAAAIPPSTLIALRRNCQCVARHSRRALAAMSPRRAEAVRAVAAHVREVELLRFREHGSDET